MNNFKNLFFYTFMLFFIFCTTILQQYLSTNILFENISDYIISVLFHSMSLILIYFTYFLKTKQFDKKKQSSILIIVLIFWLQCISIRYFFNINILINFIYFISPIFYLLIIYNIILKNTLTTTHIIVEAIKVNKIIIFNTFLIYFFTWGVFLFSNKFIFLNKTIPIYYFILFFIFTLFFIYFISKWNLKYFDSIFNKRILTTLILFLLHSSLTFFIYNNYPEYISKFVAFFLPHVLIMPFVYLGFLLFFLFSYNNSSKKLN